MSTPEKAKRPRKSWVKPMAAAFTFGGVGLFRGIDPAGFKGLSLAIAGPIGAGLAVLGYAVGRLIDRIRE